MTWPVWVLLALAAYRLTRLLGWDDLTIPFRAWLTGMSDREHTMWADFVDELAGKGHDAWEFLPEQGEAPPPVGKRRFYLSRLIRCPWCAGFWISLGVAALWWAAPHPVEVLSVPLALSAGVGFLAKLDA